jgi:hypothetical protein
MAAVEAIATAASKAKVMVGPGSKWGEEKLAQFLILQQPKGMT